LVRAVVASTVGTAIEWYDFFLYGVVAALVFPQRFFPASDPFVGTLLAFSTFFVGFASRPIGAAIFGHYGDRLGRKASLIATLVLMGVATAGIGLIPDYHRIGIWGGALLTVGRMLQGIAVGGEWGGSVLLAAEWGDARRRGFIASWPQFGAPCGLVLANGALWIMNRVAGDEFVTWGWRVPFVASLILVLIGFYIRVGIHETPAFARVRAEGRIERAPVVEALRQNWKEVLLTALLRTGQMVPFYLFTTYVLTYGTQVLHLDRRVLLNDVVLYAFASLFSIPIWGFLSDHVGRRRLLGIGCAAMVVWPFVYFALLDTREAALVMWAIVLSSPIHDMQYAPQAAVIAETFPSRLRYSGSSLGYQLASIPAGLAPIVALWLFEMFRTSTVIALYMSISGVISLVALRALADRSTEDLEAH
jgi:metabolite-proton symporter